mmetsp:Transcript_3535/g.4452  ORF Transcript_3535/g.4452 Transcript_3535/m.4452 type:complete len:83 (-) Transcript_3535:71-319(-)
MQRQIRDSVQAIYNFFGFLRKLFCCRTNFQARIFRRGRQQGRQPPESSIMLAERLHGEDGDDDDDEGDGADDEDEDPEGGKV